jgi:hypothetical protein
MPIKRLIAGIILFMLLVTPFLNWRLGAILWMSAWLTFIFQKIFTKHNWNIGRDEKEHDNSDDQKHK